MGHRSSSRRLLIGRERDGTNLEALVQRRWHVTMVGAAGVGKSRLARELASRWGQGAFFCDVTQASDADDLLNAVVRALAMESGEGRGVERIGAVLAAHGRACLILDGMDRVGAAAWDETVGAWLDACPELHVLVTARGRLKVDGEAVFTLGPLALPDDGGPTSPAEELFLRCAEAATGRDLREDGAVPPAIRELVRRLDGIPLALEIAASTLHVLSPVEFLERRSVILDTPAPAESWGGGSLRAALEVSWARLSREEQDALGAVTTFAGDFEVGGAEAVLGPNALGVLAQLCDASLLASAPLGQRTRFRMFDCVRQFAVERSSPAVLAGARSRHAAFFGGEALRWTLRGEDGDRQPAIAWLLAEESNVFAVVRRALDAGAEVDAPAVERAAGALAGLAWVWLGRGPLEPHARVLSEMEAAVRGRSLGASMPVAAFLLVLANVRRHLGEFDAATRAVEGAVQHARELAMPLFDARCLLESARLARLRGDGEMARASVNAAEAIGETTGDAGLRAAVVLAQRLASRPLDEPALERASRLARESGDPLVIARVELAFGTYCFAAGRPEDALEHVRRVEAASGSQHHHHTWRARASLVAGNALAELGRDAEARAAFEVALASARAAGHRRSEAEARGNLALLDFEVGDVASARDGLTCAVELVAQADPLHLFFVAALVAVDASTGEPGADTSQRFAELRAVVEGSAPALGVEIGLFGEMVWMAGADAAPSPPAPNHGPTRADGVARIARRVRERVRGRLSRNGLVIGHDAAWFRPAQGAPVPLEGRPVLRALLRELVHARMASPPELVSRERLVRSIWPDERSSARSMGNRLSVALSTLRSLGLRALTTSAQGIGLDPAMPVVLLDAAEPPPRAG